MTKRRKGQIVIRKSNRLVEAKYKLDIWETRVFTKALSMIRKDDDDFKTYRIYLSDLIDEFGLVKGLSYKYLKEAARSLNKRTVILLRETETGKREFQTNIVTGVDTAAEDNNNIDSMYIEIDFHKNLKNSLLELKKEFTTYDIRNVVSLPSAYSYRVYELLKQYEKIKQRTLDLKELKEIVGAIEFFGHDSPPVDHYPLYGNFRQKVLLKAQRDLKKHTDISFTFEPVKRGRKVTGVKFFISSNAPIREEIKQAKPSTPSKEEILETLLYSMREWDDIDEGSVRKLLDKYGNERILAAYNQTKEVFEKGQIRDSAGKYFYGLAHNAPTLFDQRQGTKKELQKRSQRQEEISKGRKNIEEKINKLQVQLDKLRPLIFATIEKENMDIMSKVMNQLKAHRIYDSKRTEEENLLRTPVKAFLWHRIRQMLPEKFVSIILVEEKIKQLEKDKRRV